MRSFFVKEDRDKQTLSKVSIVIPARNEVDCIGGLLDGIPKDRVDEILVVDGHSTDGTPELIRSLGYNVIPEEGKGFGAACSTGTRHAKGDIIVIMDADGSHNPEDMPRLLDKLHEGYDVVFGSRYLPGSGSADDTWFRYVGNKMFTFLLNLVHGVRLSDSLFLYVAARAEVFKSLEIKSANFEYCMEFPIKVHKAGFKYTDIPVFELKRFAGESKVSAIYHGFRILWALLKG